VDLVEQPGVQALLDRSIPAAVIELDEELVLP
jgi:hypothetical protein